MTYFILRSVKMFALKIWDTIKFWNICFPHLTIVSCNQSKSSAALILLVARRQNLYGGPTWEKLRSKFWGPFPSEFQTDDQKKVIRFMSQKSLANSNIFEPREPLTTRGPDAIASFASALMRHWCRVHTENQTHFPYVICR